MSDPGGTIASPFGFVERKGGKADLRSIAAVVTEHEVGRIVVGLPIHMDGRHGPEAEAAEKFARSLGETTGLEVAMIDERWTTVEAERSLREMGQVGKKGRKRKQHVDAVAASLLLRAWLDREANTR